MAASIGPPLQRRPSRSRSSVIRRCPCGRPARQPRACVVVARRSASTSSVVTYGAMVVKSLGHDLGDRGTRPRNSSREDRADATAWHAGRAGRAGSTATTTRMTATSEQQGVHRDAARRGTAAPGCSRTASSPGTARPAASCRRSSPRGRCSRGRRSDRPGSRTRTTIDEVAAGEPGEATGDQAGEELVADHVDAERLGRDGRLTAGAQPQTERGCSTAATMLPKISTRPTTRQRREVAGERLDHAGEVADQEPVLVLQRAQPGRR